MKKNNIVGPHKLIMEAVNKKTAETYFLFHGCRISARALAKNSGVVKGLLNGADKKCFVSYRVEGGKLRWVWASKVVPDDFEGRLIFVKPFFMDQAMIKSGLIERLADRARKFHKAGKLKVQFSLSWAEKEKMALCAERGLKIANNLLAAKVTDSLKYLSGKKLAQPEGYTLAELDVKRRLQEYLRVQIAALKSDRTSSMYAMPKERIRKIFLKFHADKPETKTFGVSYSGRLAGVCTVSISKRPRKTGLLASICVLPAHRGKGLSTALYYAGLSWLKSRGVERYNGISTTERVLGNAKKMKRDLVACFLKLG